LIVRGHIKEGKFTANTQEQVKAKFLALGDGFVEVQISRIPGDRVSERLRRYYWMLLRLIAQYLTEDTGHAVTEKDMHDHVSTTQLSQWFMNFDTMEPYQDRVSHVFLETEKLKEVCENLKIFWAERGLYLPDPHEDVFTP